ncbi:MAG TPA: alpha-amylase family glycosyl hydrolase [Fimbriimonadaceae bacterium]|jgi:1,4-alpha-glucan branching enzyme
MGDVTAKYHDATQLAAADAYLEPYRSALADRSTHLHFVTESLVDHNLESASTGHRYFGFNRDSDGMWYREWAPEAQSLSLIGDFNHWDRHSHPLFRDSFGVWSIYISDWLEGPVIKHESRVKVAVRANGAENDRIPAYIRRVIQEPDGDFVGQYWHPREPYRWQNLQPNALSKEGLRIYEAHVGMAFEDGRVGQYRDFADEIIPRIAELGYNAIQLMAVMEHPYYGSFGYHVSNFFAPSSRFGTPEDLKYLIDTAHGLGIRVIMDIVHSHAVKNVREGLNRFDGSDHQYFHAGQRGEHKAWDSLTFDYGKPEVLRFLLSNVRYWLEEFKFDGFRFDGVTSMLYRDHGIGRAFVSFDDYFGPNVDDDALAYLTLANEVAHTVNRNAITIAEDVSGMPGIAVSHKDGGIGFDYRMAMAVPDLWIKLLKEKKDEDWPLGHIYHELTNRRPAEKNIAYAESHDQALVGDKTLAFWLMDKHMYEGMSKFSHDPIIARGIALHKMIRLITFSLGGNGYLNFMGNEFGHPEWIDFPRQENNFSHHYARRQWSLVSQEHLHYHELRDFDKAMLSLDETYGLLQDPFIQLLACHEDTRQLIYRRGPLVFAFNFHPTESYSGLRIPVPDPADYRVVLNTNSPEFGGFGEAELATYPWQGVPMYSCKQSVQIYIPARSAQVLAPLTR